MWRPLPVKGLALGYSGVFSEAQCKQAEESTTMYHTLPESVRPGGVEPWAIGGHS